MCHRGLAKLNPQHVQAFIKARLSDGLSARTVKLSLLILRMALKQAVRWDTISRNVAALVDPPRVQRPEVKPLSDVEARTFLEAVRGKRLEAAYLLLLSLGLRRGETLGLRWQDIDFEKRTACVRQTLQRVGGRSIDGQPSRLMFKAPKSALSRRTLPLSESLVKALKAHRARQLEEGLAAGPRWQDTGLVFTTAIGTPFEPRRLVADFKCMLQEAGLPIHTRLHDLRHSAASLLLVQGVQPRVVMELLGHSQISLTMDTYSHVVPAATREAAEKMEAILGRAG